MINGISQIPEGDRMLLVFLFLFGFGTKAGVIPLSLIWLPSAHAEAPPPISATMSGILVKAGVIAMAKAVFPFALVSGALHDLHGGGHHRRAWYPDRRASWHCCRKT